MDGLTYSYRGVIFAYSLFDLTSPLKLSTSPTCKVVKSNTFSNPRSILEHEKRFGKNQEIDPKWF